MQKLEGEKRGSIIKRIQGLLALSAKNDNQHQAASAAEKATELLLKYELSLDEVTRKESEYTWQDRNKFESTTWKVALYTELAYANLCDVVYATQTRTMHIVGRQHSIEIVEYFYHYLTEVTDRLADEAWETYQATGGCEYTVRRFKHGFRVGVAASLIKRIQETKKAQDNQTRALVLVNDKALSVEVKKRFPRTKTERSYGRVSTNAFEQGKAAGESISLHTGVHGQKASGYIQ